MKNLKLNQRLLAVLVAGGISTTLVGCSNSSNSEEKESTSVDSITSFDTIGSTSSIDTLIEETTKETTSVVTSSETTLKSVTDEDGKKGIFVNGSENDNNFYIESGIVNIYGNGVEPNYEIESSTTKEPVVTTVPNVKEESIVTTVVTTKEEPVVTTTTTSRKKTEKTTKKETTVTTKNTETIKTGKYVYTEMDLNAFEQLTDSLYKELKCYNVVKSSGKLFTKADLYSTVYIYNIDFISEDLKQTLIDRGYIPDDVATLMVDANSVQAAISSYNQSRMTLNTNIDETLFAMEYLGYTEKEIINEFIDLYNEEPVAVEVTYDYNPTGKVKDRAINRIRKLDIDDYYKLKNEFDSKNTIDTPMIAYFNTTDNKEVALRKDQLGVMSYEINDFVDISVAVYDEEAKQNVYNSLKMSVDASLDNTKAIKTLNNFSNFYMGDKTCTTLTDCGAGATYAISTNALAYSTFMGYNAYKNLRGFADSKEQYEQVKARFKIMEESCVDLANVMKVHEGCNIQYTK